MKTDADILVDIDETLDHLIENATAIKQISHKPLFINEVEALEKTQESLLARLTHMQELLNQERQRKAIEKQSNFFSVIEQKLVRFGKRNAQMLRSIEARLQNHSSFRIKRKKKQLGGTVNY